MPSGVVFECALIENRPGFISVLIKGNGARQLFKNEAGGHRWQRNPPTEKRGRIHTSTVTVAVLDPDSKPKYQIDDKDIDIQTKRGSGKGGQHRNKTDSCVVATHKPTNVSVTIDGRSQHANKELAVRILAERISESQVKDHKNKRDKKRKQQLGTGMRADKRRTYRSQDDSVVDHITGQTWRLSKWMKGNW